LAKRRPWLVCVPIPTKGVEGHFYNVPYSFARTEVEVRLASRAVEIFAKGERIAVHLRSSGSQAVTR
jgi:hypothetical protein